MSDQRPPPEDDPAANTEMFRAFAERPEPPATRGTGNGFRLLTLAGGLLLLAVVIYLLLS